MQDKNLHQTEALRNVTDQMVEAFETWAKKRALDLSITADAWGERIYLHPHIQSFWFGWQAALSAGGEAQGVTITPKMAEAGKEALHACGYDDVAFTDAQKVYRAMRAAAPAIPQSAGLDAGRVKKSGMTKTDLQRLKDRFDSIFNNVLCDMTPGWDDSIEGFNKAWGVVSDIFDTEMRRATE